MINNVSRYWPTDFREHNTNLPVYKNDFEIFDDRNTVFFPCESRLPFYFQLLTEICHAEGIKCEFFSNDWLLKLTKNDKTRYIFGYKFGINNQAAGQIADDKFATYSILKSAQIPVVEQTIFYNSNNRMNYAKFHNSPEYVAEYLHNHDDNIVIKPATGTCGQSVMHITRELQIPAAFEKVFRQSHSAVMCPFYQITHEYRLIMLDGEEKLTYMKSLSLGSDGWKFNLAAGAKAMDVTDKFKKAQLVQLAQKTVSTIGLRFCSVDIIETQDGELLVMEVNSGVMIKRFLQQRPDRYTQVYNLYREAILKMFDI